MLTYSDFNQSNPNNTARSSYPSIHDKEKALSDLQQQRLAFINAGLSGGFEYSKVADWANEEFGLKIIMAEQRIEDLKRLNRNV